MSSKQRIVPTKSGKLEGLPKAYIIVGYLDLFAQEDIDYSRRLMAAGVPTELHVYPGGCHAFDMLVPGVDISKSFTADIHQALKRALRILRNGRNIPNAGRSW